MKKALSILLSVALLLSSLAIPASAYSYEKNDSIAVTGETNPDDFKCSPTDKYITQAEITKYTGTDTDIVIPSLIDGLKIIAIGSNAFWGNTSLKSVTIPDSVKTIYSNAFYGCSSLTNISIPDSVISINHSAFVNCSSLVNLHLPDSIKTIGTYAFKNCTSLTSVVLTNSMTNITNNVFYGCSSLTSVIIPKSIKSIGTDAFKYCSDDLVIYGYKDSFAETYANKNGITFEVIENFMLGDVDGDKTISIMDATLIQLHISKDITLSNAQIMAANTDKDGKISVLDATFIQCFIAEFITEF